MEYCIFTLFGVPAESFIMNPYLCVVLFILPDLVPEGTFKYYVLTA